MREKIRDFIEDFGLIVYLATQREYSTKFEDFIVPEVYNRYQP